MIIVEDVKNQSKYASFIFLCLPEHRVAIASIEDHRPNTFAPCRESISSGTVAIYQETLSLF